MASYAGANKSCKHTHTHICLRFWMCVSATVTKKNEKNKAKIAAWSGGWILHFFFLIFVLQRANGKRVANFLLLLFCATHAPLCNWFFFVFFTSFPTLLHCLYAADFSPRLSCIFTFFGSLACQRSFNLAATNLPLPQQVRLIKQIPC